MQVVAHWVVMWKVGNTYLKYRTQMPTTLRAVQSTTINCMRAVLDYHSVLDYNCEFPQFATDWPAKVRMPTCDSHVSNIGADNSYVRDMPDQTMHKFV